jgi:hypothetical protein
MYKSCGLYILWEEVQAQRIQCCDAITALMVPWNFGESTRLLHTSAHAASKTHAINACHCRAIMLAIHHPGLQRTSVASGRHSDSYLLFPGHLVR